MALGIVLGAIAAVVFAPGRPLYPLELKCLDARVRLRGEQGATNTVIVGVDEQSINDPRLGRWEWDRVWHSRLIEKLLACAPRAIVFDVIFADPSRLNAADDRALALATAAAGKVFFPCHVSETAPRRQPAETDRRLDVSPGLVVHQQLLPSAPYVVPPLPELAAAAAGCGVIAARPDQDGVVRRVFFLLREMHSGKLYATLPLTVAAAVGGWELPQMRFDLARSADLSPRCHVPLDEAGSAVINYLGPAGTVPQFSFVDVLDGRFSPQAFKGRIVLVGLTAPGLQDAYPTPFPGVMMGVEIQAQTIENLLAGGFARQSDHATAVGLAILLGVLAALAAGLLRPLVGLAVVVLGVAVYHVAGMRALAESGVALPMLGPTVAALLAYVPVAVFRLKTEEAGRRRLRQEFGRYAPPQVVARLDAGTMQQRSAGVIRTVTALFADVRGFTAWSAEAEPRQVVRILNTYFEAMTELAFDLEGTVDNIVGDEVFITFNVLADQPDHIRRAADLAVNMIGALDELNRRWLADGDLPQPLRIGIGIHTGEALVGNLGSSVRTQYTVLGQTVNLASRLQSLNKELGTTTLCTREVAAALGGAFETTDLGPREVRGHPVPVDVFEIVRRR